MSASTAPSLAFDDFTRFGRDAGWLSMGGRDYIVGSGDCLAVTGVKGGAIISALREEYIFFALS